MNIPSGYKKKMIIDIFGVLIEELEAMKKQITVSDKKHIDAVFYVIQTGISGVTELFLNEKNTEKREEIYANMGETFIKTCGGYWSSILLMELEKVHNLEIEEGDKK